MNIEQEMMVNINALVDLYRKELHYPIIVNLGEDQWSFEFVIADKNVEIYSNRVILCNNIVDLDKEFVKSRYDELVNTLKSIANKYKQDVIKRDVSEITCYLKEVGARSDK